MNDFIDALDKLGQAARPRQIDGEFVRRDGTRTSQYTLADQVAVNRLTGASLALWQDMMAVVALVERTHRQVDNGPGRKPWCSCGRLANRCMTRVALSALQDRVEDVLG